MLKAKTLALYEALCERLPDSFTKDVLSGSLRVLNDDGNPIRGNLFALGVREMVGYLLRAAAPDESIRACAWFPLDERTRGKVSKPDQVTRRDRMVYITQGGISDAMLQELKLQPDEMHVALMSTLDDLNKFTHVQPRTMLGSAAETDTLVDGVLETLSDFLDSIEEFRNEVSRAVLDAVNLETLGAFLFETHDALDELSTHTQVDDVQVDKLDVVGIDAQAVTLMGSGTVYVVLQYGSGSDKRRGDDASMNDDYPFTMKVRVSTQSLKGIRVLDLKVDNTSFFGPRIMPAARNNCASHHQLGNTNP